MHPNAYLRTFWQLELRPTIFVAMSLADAYRQRFTKVVEPAIRGIRIGGVNLEPLRVDLSQSGDSILTEIVDGIAHSRLFLADVSTVGKDATSGAGYRNGNVMYEVGIALACRRPQDVLLLRDDHDKFLFDVSTIPHLTLDFTSSTASEDLQKALLARLREQEFSTDARVKQTLTGLSNQELRILKELNGLGPNEVRGWNITGSVLSVYEMALCRLLDKGIIRMEGEFDAGYPGYSLTELGRIAAATATTGIQRFVAPSPPSPTETAPTASE